MKTYTIKELEPILKRKEKTIRYYISNNILNASLFNNRYVITEEDIISASAKQEVKTIKRIGF